MIQRLSTVLCVALILAAAPCARAAQTPRVSHTATLLPIGNILIAGGIDQFGTFLNTTEVRLAATGRTYANGPIMAVQRSSHTATMMANGCVLIAGGWNGATANNDADVYDPTTQTIVANVNGLGVGVGRYNHTATSLNSGKVLLCGGQKTSGAIHASCMLFTPIGTAGGIIPCGGSFAPTSMPLQLGRALHTAVLLKDGKVWFAGGLTASGGFTQTTERYDPSGDSFNSAQPLAESRVNHTATMLGDGKVLVAGGHNGQDNLANVGVLDTLEIYDPVTNTITPGPKLLARREMHSATLTPDGMALLLGGIGNITTTYANLSGTLLSGTLTDTWVSQNSTGTINGGSAVLKADFSLGVPVNGTIHDGYVMFSTPSATFASGKAYFTPGTDNPAFGLRADLEGESVVGGGIATNLTLAPMTGSVSFTPKVVALVGNRASGSLSLSGILNEANPSRNVNPSNIDLTLQVTIAMSPELAGIGASVIAGTITITSGMITQSSSYTFTVTGGTIGIPANTPIDIDGNLIFFAKATGLRGLIAYDGVVGSGQSFPSGMAVPQVGSQAAASLSGTLNYVASKVNLKDAAFNVDVATVVIRSMVLGWGELYNPKTNSSSLLGGGPASFGHTTTLLPNGDVFMAGGFDCVIPGCASFAAQHEGSPPVRIDRTFMSSVGDFSVTPGRLLTPRAFHTSTLLPDNTILVVGGTNGPSVLASAEIFSPAAGVFAVTRGSMRDARDLHTATLLPNGRVLIAGGFTTNATSTGSTNSAEIYYPDTQLFFPTSLMISSRSNHTATLLPNGNVMVFGGFGPNDIITGTAEIYYSTSGVWKSLSPSPQPRTLHTATLLKDGRLMVAGGNDTSGTLKSVYMYSPGSNAWFPDDDMPVALRSHTATLLFDGRVLVAGGNSGNGEFNASYIYDPTAVSGSRWISTISLLPQPAGPPLGQPRFGHTATLLPNGSVMISGGSTRFGEIPTEIEVYHINESSWAPAGVQFQGGARAFHTMTLAANGMVHAIGGSDGVIGGQGTSLLGSGEQGYFTSEADKYTKTAPPSIRRSTITSTIPATPLLPGDLMAVNGLGFRGGTEASGGGAGAANSSFSFPRMTLQQIDGTGFVADLTSSIYQNASNSTIMAAMDTSLNVTLPPVEGQLPTGWYNVRIGVNGVYSDAKMFQVGPAKPGAITGLTGVALGTSSMSWTWTAVSGSVDGYNIYDAATNIFLTAVPVTSYVQTGLQPSQPTAILVAAYTLSGDGPLAASGTFYTLPTTVLVGQPIVTGRTTNSIDWGWSEPVGVSNFEIYNATSGVLLGTSIRPNFTEVGLGTNTEHSIRVRAVNSAGPGPLSPSATTYNAAATPIPFPITVLTTGSVILSWLDNGNPSGTRYRVSGSAIASDGSIFNTVTTTSTELSAGFGELIPSSRFDYEIFAINNDDSDVAASVTGSTWTLPNDPTPLTTLGTTPTSIAVLWSANNNSSSATYQVTYTDDDQFAANISTPIAFSAKFGGTSTTINALVTSATYYVHARASNPFGQLSPFSNVVKATTSNGGGPKGSIRGQMLAGSDSSMLGWLGNSRLIQLRAPAHTFPIDVTVTVSSSDQPTGSLCPNGVNIAFSIVDSPELQPNGSLFLSFDYQATELGAIPASRALLLRYDPGSNTCVPLETIVDAQSGRMTARINHFSLFQVGQVPLATSAETARLFPNPYYTARDGFLTVDNVPPSARIRIFTLRGEQVLDVKANSTGLLTWSGTNGSGRAVASGVYLVMIESGGTKKILKLAVIR